MLERLQSSGLIARRQSTIASSMKVAPAAADTDRDSISLFQLPEEGRDDSHEFSKSIAVAGTRYMKAPRIVYKGHRSSVISLGYLSSPEYVDTLILTGSEDKTMKVWSLCSGQLITTLTGHKQRISGAVGFCSSRCPPLAVSASWDETLRIWPVSCCFTDDPATVNAGQLLADSVLLSGFKNRVLGVTIVPLSKEGTAAVAAGSSDNTIQIWSLPEGEKLYVLQDIEDVTWNMCIASWIVEPSVDYDLRGPVVLGGTKTNIVRIWSLLEAAAHKQQALKQSGGTPWQEQSQKPHRVIRGQHTSAVMSIATFDCDAPLVVTVCRDLDIRVFSITTGELLKTLRGHTNTITNVTAHDVSVARGGAIIVSSSSNGNMRVWKFSTGELLRTFNGHTEEIGFVTTFRTPEPGKDDLIIVSGSKDQSARTWLFAEEKNLRVLPHRVLDFQYVQTADGTAPVNQNPLLKSVRIFALDMYSSSEDQDEAMVVTGSDSGLLRAYSVSQTDGGSNNELRWVSQAHDVQVQALVIFNPMYSTGSSSSSKVKGNNNNDNDSPLQLQRPLIISGSRDGVVVISEVHSGVQLRRWVAHPSVVTSVCVFAGRPVSLPTGAQRVVLPAIDPFFVTGSEDNTAKIWRLADQQLLHHLQGHEFDVAAVAIYFPRPVTELLIGARKDKLRSAAASAVPSRAVSPRTLLHSPSFSVQDNDTALSDPIVITGGLDNNVCLWSSSSGELIEVLADASAFITTLAVIEPRLQHGDTESKPLLAAGDGEGRILVWSLRPPYKLLHTFAGHTDEIACLSALDAEGMYPVLVSGSLDTTMRVWDLRKMAHKLTLEGHTGDVMAVRVFTDGESDAALASGSVDGTVRVLFDFLGDVPNVDIVMQQFNFDLKGTNAHILETDASAATTTTTASAWPRISLMVQREGADNFFGLYYQLFGEALRANRSDFLTEFLPLTRLGLLKSNSELEDGNFHDGRGGLLSQALLRRDLVAVRAIVGSWCAFLSAGPQSDSDLLYDRSIGRPSMRDCLLLARRYPKEFEKLICSVRLLPTQYNKVPVGAYCLYEDREKGIMIDRYNPQEHGTQSQSSQQQSVEQEQPQQALRSKPGATTAFNAAQAPEVDDASPRSDTQIYSGVEKRTAKTVAAVLASKEEDEEGGYRRPQTFLFVPLNGAVHMEMLKAYTAVCAQLDSVEIFHSEAGQLMLSFAWHTFGIRAHLSKFAVYLFYVAVSCASTLSFEFTRRNFAVATYALISLQLLLNGFFIRAEAQQYLTGIFEYLSDIWNLFDFIVIMGSTAANVLRLLYWRDTAASVIVLSFTSIFMWSNILYYLRAFESTGPLVSMILKISSDMRYLLLVVLLVLVGFSQAFWLISEGDASSPFSSIESSLLFSFSFMLGEYDPQGFDGVPLRSLGIFLSVVYMMIMSVLLLNLVIALMGDSYSAVKIKGLAQWKYEQCKIITEMQGSILQKDRVCMDTVFFRLNTEDSLKVQSAEQKASAAREERLTRTDAKIDELQRGQEELRRLLQEQAEINSTLRELIITKFS